MIVDDEPDVLISLKTVFERQNYEVVTGSNGVECLDEIEKGFKGVILIDLMMPVMDGWATINEIVKKGYNKYVCIFIITGKGTKDYQKIGMLGSFIFDYLTKPLDVNQLISSVEKSSRCFYQTHSSKL